MTSTFQRARYALWQHSSQQMKGTLEWRETPRSKMFVGVIPSVTLPGAVEVLRAGENYIDVALSDFQMELVATWLENLPSSVLPSAAQTDGCIQHSGPYVCLHCDYNACQTRWPQQGERVSVRVTAGVKAIGSMRKACIIITDVLLT